MKNRIAISGAGGKMGCALLNSIARLDWCELVAAIESPDSNLIGLDAGELLKNHNFGVTIQDSLDQAAEKIDVLIDFSAPEATLNNIEFCSSHLIPIVIGTTGFASSDEELIDVASKIIPICCSANYSAGINLCFDLIERATEVLGKDADVEIIESHHRGKIDAPSGTALAMGEAIAAGLGRDLSDVSEYGRVGDAGPRDSDSIGFSVIRAGNIIGEHTVMFAVDGEILEITHKASDREAFSAGALRAARWLIGRAPSLYSMRDVIANSDETPQ